MSNSLITVLGQSCRKDRLNLLSQSEVNNGQLIKQATIEEWLKANSISNIISPDWKKAKQGVVSGLNVVRVPLLNIDRYSMQKRLANLKEKGIASMPKSSTSNSNYFDEHPPELFLIEYKGKINAHIFNFIPSDPKKEFGENGIWTGKLNDWNLEKDTLYVQEITKNVVVNKYLLVSEKNTNNVIQKNSLNSQLSSIDGSRGVSPPGFFKWLIGLVESFLSNMGSLLGITEWVEYSNDLEPHWVIKSFSDWTFLGDDSGTGPASSSGWPFYGQYMPIYDASLNPDGSVIQPYPYTGGPIPTRTISDDAIDVLDIVEPEQINFLTDKPDIAQAIIDYINANGLTYPNIEFGKWAVEYLMDNSSKSIEQLDNDYDAMRYQNYAPRDREPTSYPRRTSLSNSDGSDNFSSLNETTPLYTYPNGVATVNLDAFNCHYHTFGLQYATKVDDEHPKWVIAISLKASEWDQVTGSAQVGDKVLYYKNYNDKPAFVHSAIVTEVDADGYATKVSSKMGPYEIIIHHPRDIPVSYGSSDATFTINIPATTNIPAHAKTLPSRIYWRKK